MGIFSIFSKSNTLYFPGCKTIFKHKDIYNLYTKIFARLGINFKVIERNICSGLVAYEGGNEKVARKVSRRNHEIFREEEVETIITSSPEDHYMFQEVYPNFLPEWNIEVISMWNLIRRKLESKPRLVKNKAMQVVTYHDNCYLSRYLGIIDDPRKILEMIGYEVKEMHNYGLNSMCCGSCGVLPITNPALANDIARERIIQAKRIGVDKIIVSSIENYELLKKNSVGTGIEIVELSEVLSEAIGVKKDYLEKSDEEVSEDLEGEENILEEEVIEIKE